MRDWKSIKLIMPQNRQTLRPIKNHEQLSISVSMQKIVGSIPNTLQVRECTLSFSYNKHFSDFNFDLSL